MFMYSSSLLAEEVEKKDKIYNIIKLDDTKRDDNRDLKLWNILWNVEKTYKIDRDSDKIFYKPTNIITDNNGFERCASEKSQL